MSPVRPSQSQLVTRGPAIGVDLRLRALGYDAGAPVLDALDLRLEPGCISCLLGASGVGKSTLLRVLAGQFDQADAAAIRCDDGAALRGRVAWMDQRDLLLPWLSVLDNLLLGARLRGEATDQTRALALLAEVGMAEHATARPQALSTGMRQRAALARTLMERKPVVLMDEPFSALDVLTRHRLQALAVRLLAGRTVLLVTHDPAEAVRMADHINVLEGRPARLARMPVPPGAAPRDATGDSCLPALRALQSRLGLTAARTTASSDAAPGSEDGPDSEAVG